MVKNIDKDRLLANGRKEYESTAHRYVDGFANNLKFSFNFRQKVKGVISYLIENNMYFERTRLLESQVISVMYQLGLGNEERSRDNYYENSHVGKSAIDSRINDFKRFLEKVIPLESLVKEGVELRAKNLTDNL